MRAWRALSYFASCPSPEPREDIRANAAGQCNAHVAFPTPHRSVRSSRSTSALCDQEGDPDYTWIEFSIGTSFIVLWGGGATIGIAVEPREGFVELLIIAMSRSATDAT